ncbi:MAG TPA: protein kinase [Candidatus Eisenbacteria bacterium]|nr:protein kinase [Candidatus Eisenbacteria bacterium]
MSELIGGTISHYRIVSRLGAGGMGVVYRARDERLGRDLALKILPAESMADETARARLLREARMASSLNHPHIAHIYEVGEDGGYLYIAMELVEGRPLSEAIPAGGLPPDTLVRQGIQIADALAYAHERGIMHRDLKTANVMITADGWVKVLDFGLAKRMQDDETVEAPRDLSLTASGMVVGTPNYLPPEVLLGGKADARGDVWALGVVLYEMAAGRLPFGGASLTELAGAIVSGAPTPLSGRVPVGVQAVIGRCLAKNAEERFRTGAEARAALDALSSGAAPPPASRRRVPRPVWIGAVTAAALAIAAALYLNRGAIGDRLAGRPPRPHIASLAVLPLANLSGDPEQEYFADGMTEELITSLAPIRTLTVISRTSVMRFKGSKEPLRDIARKLDVEGIVEGSVQRAGDRIRITAQLIEAGRDRHLWAQSYERDFKDVLALQSEVASDIARQIQMHVSPGPRGGGPRRPVNPAAFELYLRGRYEWAKMTPASMTAAVQHFEKALALDPGDARYSSGIADSYLAMVQVLETVPSREGMAKVKEYARRALAADENSAEAHASMGAALYFGDWDAAGAERELKRAIELNPGYSTARLVYSVLLTTQARVDEALEQDRLAMQSDPLSVFIHWNAVGTLLSARRFAEASALADRTFELDPTSPLSQSGLVRVREMRGDYPGALMYLKKYMPKEFGGAELVAKAEKAYAADGPTGYWKALLDHHSAHRVGPAASPTRLAMLAAGAGEKKRAIDYLEAAYAQHLSDVLFLRVEPCWDPLRTEPRFQALVARVEGRS